MSNERINQLVAAMGSTRVLELVMKGQQWEESMRKRAEYQKERLNDPHKGPELKQQRREYQRKRNAEIKQALDYVRKLHVE